MRVAVKRDQTVISEDGRIVGHDAGATLVRRFLRIFPGAQVIGPSARRCHGFDVVPLEFLDPENTVIINMDVLDSPTIWNTIYQASGGTAPKIMNFVWWPVSFLERPEQKYTAALSCAMFPTFAASERTASEVKELVHKSTLPQLEGKMKLEWVNLGFRVDHVQERQETAKPIVLYPAIYLAPVKRPDLFKEIVERVRKQVPIEVEMRLQESSLISEKAMQFSQLPWVWVGPLTSTRSSYYEALSRTTAFLATATDESYGMSYVEALGSGVIGILPDEEWARALVPVDYPFFYRDKATAEKMLLEAVTAPEECRKEIDRAAGGSFIDWIARHHSDAAFDREITETVKEWFG
ncbi:MAG: glycosyltransferase family 1 protein [Scrofimicrobium sp.]